MDWTFRPRWGHFIGGQWQRESLRVPQRQRINHEPFDFTDNFKLDHSSTGFTKWNKHPHDP
ncbi:MAG: hypothetical protein AAB380_05250 [Verrucomicrobiota bacterium]